MKIQFGKLKTTFALGFELKQTTYLDENYDTIVTELVINLFAWYVTIVLDEDIRWNFEAQGNPKSTTLRLIKGEKK
jgi:hypothetical protein